MSSPALFLYSFNYTLYFIFVRSKRYSTEQSKYFAIITSESALGTDFLFGSSQLSILVSGIPVASDSCWRDSWVGNRLCRLWNCGFCSCIIIIIFSILIYNSYFPEILWASLFNINSTSDSDFICSTH